MTLFMYSARYSNYTQVKVYTTVTQYMAQLLLMPYVVWVFVLSCDHFYYHVPPVGGRSTCPLVD